jgi:pyrroline-5-carboxylate reductase
MADGSPHPPRIAFVGAGNMASSIIGGLVDNGHPADRISAADPYPASLERLRAIAPVALFSDNATAVAGADIIILAVKPQVMAEATDSIAAAVQANHSLVISIAAGVTIASMQARLGPDAAIVRCMPNTPALLGCGASGLFANDSASPQQREFAQRVLSAVGMTCWVDTESELDAITALSGSGPAYFFLLTEAMIDAGIALGLHRDTATALAKQTGLGAARMALESDVQSFEADGLRDVVTRAMRAAADRALEMSTEMR